MPRIVKVYVMNLNPPWSAMWAELKCALQPILCMVIVTIWSTGQGAYFKIYLCNGSCHAISGVYNCNGEMSQNVAVV
jgi:hypothetical protein